jgi:CheY-like chemotaxis protein
MKQPLEGPAAIGVRPAAGLRILMVEDEMLLAMSLEDLLELSDCRVLRAARLPQALALAAAEEFDGALLDVNLNGEPVYPVAEVLDSRGIPFAFMTGYNASALNPKWGDRPVLRKPFQLEQLERVLRGFAAARG